jgi:hypothetical protein
LFEKDSGLAQDRHAGFCRAYSPAGPGQQRDADLGFERADALRDGSWRQIEPARRFGKRSLFGHCNKGFEKAGLHSNKIYRLKTLLSTLSCVSARP